MIQLYCACFFTLNIGVEFNREMEYENFLGPTVMCFDLSIFEKYLHIKGEDKFTTFILGVTPENERC